MTEKAFEYCKSEDWAEFLTAYPEAYTFLKERAQYRQYLELRLVLAATVGKQRELVERELDRLEAEIVSFPYSKPQPRSNTATPPPPKYEVMSPEESFFANLPKDAQIIILEVALKGIQKSLEDGEDIFDLDVVDEALHPILDDLVLFMDDKHDLSDRYLRSRGELDADELEEAGIPLVEPMFTSITPPPYVIRGHPGTYPTFHDAVYHARQLKDSDIHEVCEMSPTLKHIATVYPKKVLFA